MGVPRLQLPALVEYIDQSDEGYAFWYPLWGIVNGAIFGAHDSFSNRPLVPVARPSMNKRDSLLCLAVPSVRGLAGPGQGQAHGDLRARLRHLEHHRRHRDRLRHGALEQHVRRHLRRGR